MANMCEVCGRLNVENDVFKSKKFNMTLCERHYSQMRKHGIIAKRTQRDMNEIILKEDHAEIYLYDVNCKIKSMALRFFFVRTVAKLIFIPYSPAALAAFITSS